MGFPVAEARILDAERQLGRSFPRLLRDRLIRHNGGEVGAEGDDWTLHPVWDPTDRKRMARTAGHVVRETGRAREWPGFPGDAVSIATDGTGDHLILRPGSDRVELWDHETSESRPVDVDWR